MKKVDKPANKVFFTADLHFGHDWLVKFNNRPYSSSKEMDEALIKNWNQTVPSDGLVFVLGDIGYTSDERIIEIFKQLNGEKILIRGNHDTDNYQEETLLSLFSEIHELLFVRVQDYNHSIYHYMVLCHYPMLDWQNSYRGTWQLFGHIHTRKIKEFDTVKARLFSSQYDVGVDNNHFKPISCRDLNLIIEAQQKDENFKQSNYYLNGDIPSE